MSTISQPQRNGPRRAFGVINHNSTPIKAKKGSSVIADEVHSAKKDKQAGLLGMSTTSSKKRAASLKEADEKAAAAAMESPLKTTKTNTAAAVLPKAVKTLPNEEKVGDEYAAQDVFRTFPEVNETFWDEMEDLLEIKLANPISSEDEFDVNSYDGDENRQVNLKEEEVADE